MQITKFNHSCYYLEKDGRGLLFDPVEYDTQLPDFANLDAIIVTHLHGDHFQPAVLERVRAANPDCPVFTPADNATNIPGSHAPHAGEQLDAGIFTLTFYGASHAAILLAPISAPWLKVSETMDFIKAVHPQIVLPTHDALNSPLGNTIYDNWLRQACAAIDATYYDIHLGLTPLRHPA